MERAKTTALHGNAAAANIKHQKRHFTETSKRVKLELMRLAIWWRMALGG